jgi:hypothetical protein
VGSLLGITISFMAGRFITGTSFILFGMVIGTTFHYLLLKNENSFKYTQSGLLVLITAWCTSVSVGYNFPALFSGQLFMLLLMFTYPALIQKIGYRKPALLFVAFTTICLLSFMWTRSNFTYREQPVRNMTETLNESLPGGKWIKSNTNTYEFLNDLQKAIVAADSPGHTFTIIPDCAGYWVKSQKLNPIPIDWIQKIELNKPELLNRVISTLESIRNTNVVIVQKYEAKSLANGFIPLSNEYAVVEHVTHSFQKVYETSLFELYR